MDADMSGIYRIIDIEGMAIAMREDVFDDYDIGYPHDSVGMDGYVTVGQVAEYVRSIAREMDGELYVDDSFHRQTEEFILSSVKQSTLARLCADGYLESAIDVDGSLHFRRPPACHSCGVDVDGRLVVCDEDGDNYMCEVCFNE